ncbi:PAS domain S-box protein [Rhodocytophaga aerolata]|uniref:histidine kinase n=1 Tax=Rhodocytophaga aerolata TaxID=455078 RepID=A0ABT8R0T9_9BACT|nr:PAS domain S-box protein [Rhodocytophaga aerolata]MDO1444868.1 PAS domain S-box protein [Rhodocytophaga aerolata]
MDSQLLLQELAQGFSTAAIGKEFFRSLAQYLSKALEVDYVFIGELTAVSNEADANQASALYNQTVRSIVFWSHGAETSSTQYPLVGSLCEYVVKDNFCSFPSNVQKQFPYNQSLKQYQVDSYVGIALYNSQKQVAGLIYIMHGAPIQNISQTESLLRIVARRAELELERKQKERQLLEKNQQLQQAQDLLLQLNEQLEQRVNQRTKELQAANTQIQTLLERERAARLEAEIQQRQVETLLRQAPVALGILSGPAYTIMVANEALCKMLGKPQQEVINHPLFAILPELKGQVFEKLLDTAFSSGEPLAGTELHAIITRKGERREGYLNLVYQPIRDPKGEITGIIVVVHEVTEQVIARKKIEESESRILQILDSIPQIAWTSLPHSLNIAFFNKRWYDYTGLTQEQSQDAGWQKIIHPDDLPTVVERRTKGRSEGKSYEIENRYKRADGTYRWYLSRIVPIRDEQGAISLWVGTATDIHEQKVTQHKLEHTLKELNDKNYELDQFVYKTSHDLRAPLTSILGLINISRLEQEEATRKNYMDLIENRVHKLDNFIHSMLEYSRNARTTTAQEKINFHTLLQECLAELTYMRNFGQLTVSMEVHGDNFYSDRFRLKIIFTNLISNAIKYQDFAKEKHYLKIRISITPEQATFEFTDNGTGIEPQFQEKIFQMFFRGSEHSDGSGLGLYIVKQTVDILQGKIRVNSQVGQGTCFTVTLPLYLTQ